MRSFLLPILAGLIACSAVANAKAPSRWLKDWRKANPIWRGVHLSVGNDGALTELEGQVPALAKLGINVLVVEVDYAFQFTSRPEMAAPWAISKKEARHFTEICHANGIRPIPQINCLGHQSWAKITDRLLTIHPELDETPGKYPNNEGIYCRSWCPQNPDLPKIVLPLIDEIADGFDADAFHVGMDEVFIIGSEFCPRCKGQDRAKLFADMVKLLHRHIVKQKKMEMLMWSDRFVDGKATGYGEWEASQNDTFGAINLVPKDIIMCDWHYEQRPDYPSIKLFADKGFRVWPTGWKDVKATEAFALQAQAIGGPKVIGHLCSTWGAIGIAQLPTWDPILAAMKIWNK